MSNKEKDKEGGSGPLHLSIEMPSLPQMPSISFSRAPDDAARKRARMSRQPDGQTASHAAVHVLGVAALAYVGVKVTLPLLRTAGE